MAVKKKVKEAGAGKRDGGVKVKQTKSGQKIVKEKAKAPAEESKPAVEKKAGKEKTTKKPSVEEAASTEKTDVTQESKQKSEKKGKAKKEEKVKKEKPIVKIMFTADGGLKVKRKKTPRFRRDELYKCKKLKDVWRSPRGLDGKKKEEKRGKGAVVKVGFKNPAAIYGVIKGFKAVHVCNVPGLDAVDPKHQAAVISSAVGRKKRNAIIEEANKRKITILNPRKGET